MYDNRIKANKPTDNESTGLFAFILIFICYSIITTESAENRLLQHNSFEHRVRPSMHEPPMFEGYRFCCPIPMKASARDRFSGNRLVEIPVAAALSVVIHFADITFQHIGVSPICQNFLSSSDTAVTGEHHAFAGELHTENKRRIITAGKCEIKRIQNSELRSADIEYITLIQNLFFRFK